ncbi:methylated-DNA--[protein]-cysteine S-methyltransferase [Stenoxybacter acetivorans]|uniref:methylated-DNA--[protein]-cysteine S-methyltransferase n=1 Tax=Stenoxybacter acetivorans TaxID=422441 RepID=UPI000565BA67|nr:methylated-DNA--[protein]-cysteine S-methyltransferase [Stenoxybacter acetivorans]
MMISYYYPAPFGQLIVSFTSEKEVYSIDLLDEAKPDLPLLQGEWSEKFNAYFSGSLKNFNCPPSANGTAFQKRVWQAIAEIPCGKTETYGEIAKKLNSAARAVGQACGKNPLPIVIPCHRVVAANGGLGGFNLGGGQQGLEIKQWLLNHERAAQ